MIKLFIKDDAFHPVRASEGNLLPCLHFYEANLNIICRRIDPVLGDFVYVSTFFGKWTCSAKKKSICISIKCITISYEGCAHHGKVFKYNCKYENTCYPSNFCLLNKHLHSHQPSMNNQLRGGTKYPGEGRGGEVEVVRLHYRT